MKTLLFIVSSGIAFAQGTPGFIPANGNTATGIAQAQVLAILQPWHTTDRYPVCFLPVAANTAAAPTLAINGTSALPITKLGTAALIANDMTTTAFACVISDGTEYQLQNPQTTSGSVLDSSYQLYRTAGTAPNAGGGANYLGAAWQTDATVINVANGNAALPKNNISGVRLPPATGAHFAYLTVEVPVGWNNTIGLIANYFLQLFSSGTGTGVHDYGLSCFIPGTTDITTSLTWTTTVPASFNVTSPGVGAIDKPALTPPTCSPGTLGSPTGAQLLIRIIRENTGTATDDTNLASFAVSLPHTVQ